MYYFPITYSFSQNVLKPPWELFKAFTLGSIPAHVSISENRTNPGSFVLKRLSLVSLFLEVKKCKKCYKIVHDCSPSIVDAS